MYFIECGLGKRFRPLAIFFAMAGLIGCLPIFQVNQLASMLENKFSLAPFYTGVTASAFIGVVIIGDVKRVGKVTAKIVPFMFLAYLISSVIVIIINFDAVPGILRDIFYSAFGKEAVYGGATGLIFKEVLVTGIKRAIFSNEADVGAEAMAHGALPAVIMAIMSNTVILGLVIILLETGGKSINSPYKALSHSVESLLKNPLVVSSISGMLVAAIGDCQQRCRVH